MMHTTWELVNIAAQIDEQSRTIEWADEKIKESGGDEAAIGIYWPRSCRAKLHIRLLLSDLDNCVASLKREAGFADNEGEG